MSELVALGLRCTGWLAAILLTASLTVTPLVRLRASRGAARPRLLAARRWLGIVAASLALAHGAVALFTYLQPEPWSALRENPWLRSGALAAVLLAALLATSFPVVVRGARVVLWKPLHRLVYVAPVLVVHHLLLAPFAPRAWVLTLAVVLAGALLGRLLRPAPRA